MASTTEMSMIEAVSVAMSSVEGDRSSGLDVDDGGGGLSVDGRTDGDSSSCCIIVFFME